MKEKDFVSKYVEEDIIVTHQISIKPNIFKRIRYYFRRLFFDMGRSFSFFKARRFFKSDIPILIMMNIKDFDKPNMYISPDVIKIIKRFKIDHDSLDNYGDDGSGSACIGFSSKNQKWYGWSHRAIYGFGIGDIVEEGDLTTTSGYVEEYEIMHPEHAFKNVLPVGFKAETLEDAKRMAIAFAASVS